MTQAIVVDKLPDAFHNFRIVQISDIHFDEYTEPSFLRRVWNGSIASAGPGPADGRLRRCGADAESLFVGALHRCADTLREIACPRRFAVMGNHDVFLGDSIVRPILASVHIPLLVNEHVPIERGGHRFWLGGINDPITSVPNLDRHPREAGRSRAAHVAWPRLRGQSARPPARTFGDVMFRDTPTEARSAFHFCRVPSPRRRQ